LVLAAVASAMALVVLAAVASAMALVLATVELVLVRGAHRQLHSSPSNCLGCHRNLC
jgi:hypothetical protein